MLFFFLGTMCCTEAFPDFGKQNNRLFQEYHRTGAGEHSHYAATSPTVSRQQPSYFFSQYQTFCLFIFSVLCFIHPRPSKVADLPDSVCQVFLDKMGTANLTSLPLHAPSRLALAERALLCLPNVCTHTHTHSHKCMLCQKK